jgi:hypothetical protein
MMIDNFWKLFVKYYSFDGGYGLPSGGAPAPSIQVISNYNGKLSRGSQLATGYNGAPITVTLLDCQWINSNEKSEYFGGYLLDVYPNPSVNLILDTGYEHYRRWRLSFEVPDTGNNILIWSGQKIIGDTPEGTYQRISGTFTAGSLVIKKVILGLAGPEISGIISGSPTGWYVTGWLTGTGELSGIVDLTGTGNLSGIIPLTGDGGTITGSGIGITGTGTVVTGTGWMITGTGMVITGSGIAIIPPILPTGISYFPTIGCCVQLSYTGSFRPRNNGDLYVDFNDWEMSDNSGVYIFNLTSPANNFSRIISGIDISRPYGTYITGVRNDWVYTYSLAGVVKFCDSGGGALCMTRPDGLRWYAINPNYFYYTADSMDTFANTKCLKELTYTAVARIIPTGLSTTVQTTCTGCSENPKWIQTDVGLANITGISAALAYGLSGSWCSTNVRPAINGEGDWNGELGPGTVDNYILQQRADNVSQNGGFDPTKMNIGGKTFKGTGATWWGSPIPRITFNKVFCHWELSIPGFVSGTTTPGILWKGFHKRGQYPTGTYFWNGGCSHYPSAIFVSGIRLNGNTFYSYELWIDGIFQGLESSFIE